MAGFISLYMTAPSTGDAERIAAILLEEGLIACANILPQATALYRWEGKLHRESEAVAFLKTTEDRTGPAIARAAELHPYEVPCILALSIEGGHPPYLQWVAGEVG